MQAEVEAGAEVSPRVARLKKRIEPGDSNFHFPEWENNYLGVSTLVKKTAATYAKRVILMEKESSNGYSGFKGNALADAALADVEHKEAHLVLADFVRGWSLEGHCDGLGVEMAEPDAVHGLTVYEGKSHDFDGPRDWMLARRQSIVYAAMFAEMLAAGQRTFQQARWTWPDPGTPVAFTLPAGDIKVTHSVCFFMPAHSRGEPRYIEDEATPEALHSALPWARRKFAHILTSIEYAWTNYGKGEPLDANQLHAALACRGGAYEWDRGPDGLREFEAPEDEGAPSPWHQFPKLDWGQIEGDLLEYEKARIIKSDADAVRSARQAAVLEFLARTAEDPEQRPVKLETPNGIGITISGGWSGKKSPHIIVKLPKENR